MRISTPKFLIEVSDSNTVDIKLANYPQFLKIFKILISLKVLIILIYGVSPGV